MLPMDSALQEEGKVLIPHDGHPNELGHRPIAQVLANHLMPLLEPLLA
jgi:hypothetical protein